MPYQGAVLPAAPRSAAPLSAAPLSAAPLSAAPLSAVRLLRFQTIQRGEYNKTEKKSCHCAAP